MIPFLIRSLLKVSKQNSCVLYYHRLLRTYHILKSRFCANINGIVKKFLRGMLLSLEKLLVISENKYTMLNLTNQLFYK